MVTAVTTVTERPGPAQGAVPLPRAVRDLVLRGDRELAQARRSTDPAEAFGHAHLAALRYAAAAIAARPSTARRSRAQSAWALLAARVPELAWWAQHFASGARTRSAVDAGRFDAVSVDDAHDWVESAERFGAQVCTFLEDAAVPHRTERSAS